MGTLELLLTAPVKDYEVVLGKYLASFVMLGAILGLTLSYVVLLFWFGDPDMGPLVSGYLGILLYASTSLAVGLLASSLTGNQIVAAVVGFGILVLLTFVDQASGFLAGSIGLVLREISLTAHFDDFARGVVDTNDVVYFAVATALFLFLTVRSLESRRWR